MSFLGRTVAYGHDAHGRLSHVQVPDGEWRYEYDSSGRKKSVENVAAGLLETWDHDELGRLRSITHFDTAKSPEDEGHVIYEAEYSFGPDGRRVAMVERRASNEASETVWNYEYDGLGRLVAEKAGTRDRGSSAAPAAWSRNVRYTYDVDSNRTSEQRLHADPVEEDSYFHDSASQRLLSINHLEGGVHARTTLFEYSLAGELTSKQVRRASDNALLSAEDYTWSPKGEMESALVDHDGDGDDVVAVLYAYDDRGTLVERTSYLVDDGPASAVTERYLVDYENPTGYSQVVAEWRAEGDGPFQIARLYTYADDLRAESTLIEHAGAGAGGGGPGGPAFAHVSGVQFPLRDALGTVRASAGFGSGLTPGEASINDYRYSAFGLPLGENFAPADASTRGSLTSQSAPSPWAFTGQRIDPATGLQYHRARWLDMALGRWASVDPVWDWPGNHGSGMSYVRYDPANRADLSGLFEFNLLGMTVSVSIQSVLTNMALFSFLGFTNSFVWSRFRGASIGESFKKALIDGAFASLFAVPFLNILLLDYSIAVLAGHFAGGGSISAGELGEMLTMAILFLISRGAHQPAVVLRRPHRGVSGVETGPYGIWMRRINPASGTVEKSTPRKLNGEYAKAGLKHVIDEHFPVLGQPAKAGKSYFTISVRELLALFKDPRVVGTKTLLQGDFANRPTFVRFVNVGTNIGVTKKAHGAKPTTWMYVVTDRLGNLVTAFPIPKPLGKMVAELTGVVVPLPELVDAEGDEDNEPIE